MTTHEGRITISRNSHNEVGLEIRDERSRVLLVECKLSLEDYALAISGLGGVPVELRRWPTAEQADRIGLTKVIQREALYDFPNETDALRAAIRDHFEASKWYAEGWEINSDGIGTQQPSGIHTYTVCKWVPREEAAQYGK